MWKYGDVIAWRGIYDNHPWHIQSVIVVKDDTGELVVALMPGAESVAERTYTEGHKKDGKRRWDFKNPDWELRTYAWHTNRVLAVTEQGKYYSTMLFWNHASNEFLGYYVNFQLPFLRSHCGIDTLDLDLDIDIEPDLTYRWKDEDDYQRAMEHGIITAEWAACVEEAKPEVLDRLAKRRYPFDGTWLNWKPESSWPAPTLPENWDKI